jgi:hypothetical protein
VTFVDPVPYADGSTTVFPVPIYLVHDPHAGFLALYRRDRHPRAAWIRWHEVNQRFEDGAVGSRYTRTGEFIEGPSYYDMARFAVITAPDGTLTIDLGQYQPWRLRRCMTHYMLPAELVWMLDSWHVPTAALTWEECPSTP